MPGPGRGPHGRGTQLWGRAAGFRCAAAASASVQKSRLHDLTICGQRSSGRDLIPYPQAQRSGQPGQCGAAAATKAPRPRRLPARPSGHLGGAVPAASVDRDALCGSMAAQPAGDAGQPGREQTGRVLRDDNLAFELAKAPSDLACGYCAGGETGEGVDGIEVPGTRDVAADPAAGAVVSFDPGMSAFSIGIRLPSRCASGIGTLTSRIPFR